MDQPHSLSYSRHRLPMLPLSSHFLVQFVNKNRKMFNKFTLGGGLFTWCRERKTPKSGTI